MKTFIITCLILINYNLIGQCRDSLIDIRYIKAFEYISNSSELATFLSNAEYHQNNLKFFISPILQYFSYTLFDEEIVKKKYNISIRTSSPILKQVYDSLRAIDLRYNFYSDTLCILTKLSTQVNSKIIIYFSKIFGNTLISAVYLDRYLQRDFHKVADMNVGFYYLFTFDNSKEIKYVLTTKWSP